MRREVFSLTPIACAVCARRPVAWLALVLMALTCLTGCGGCDRAKAKAKADAKARAGKTAEELEKERQKKKPKPDFEIATATPRLSESLVSADDGSPMRLAKPGHWTSTVQRMKANKANFEGRTTLSAVDQRGRAVVLKNTPFQLTSSRPAVLAKGRVKRVENEVLVPADVNRVRVLAELTSSSGGIVGSRAAERWRLMPSHQYFLVVLAREPARYAFLKLTDSVKAPYENDNGVSMPHYRVVLADGNKPLPLPPGVLTWSSVAYIVWDEVNIARMDPAQQQALVDWLHWGGRLIVNGPDSLVALRSSFLDPSLPVEPGGIRTVTARDLAKLNAAWTPRSKGRPIPPISVTKPWSAVELKPRPGAVALRGGEGLFYEGSVGSGSIVVSAVQLSERDLVNWPGYDSFLNGGLLGRPRRTFDADRDGTWTGLQTDWADYKGRPHDAHFTTPVRWFARDAMTRANVQQVTTSAAPQANTLAGWMAGQPIADSQMVADRPGGLGEWSEFGPVSQAARQSLREASGVRVPAASFVVTCLAVYLVVLVPLNWMVFQAVGKVEWAWIAAPIVAIAGTVGVVKLAQLDIGFVRAQTEIGLLELQGEHARGHLSRYIALYSSLSTTYDLEFDDASAVATPFPYDDAFTPAFGDRISQVAFEKYDKPRLRGVPISSASTQYIHAEQMFPLAGPLRLSHPTGSPHLWQLENHTGIALADAAVVHRKIDDDGQSAFEGCWLGEVPSGKSVLLPRAPVELKRNELPYASQRQQAEKLDEHKRLSVDKLLQMAFRFTSDADPHQGGREEWRLVARVDELLPGARSSPSASQATGTTVVLAHLQLGPPRTGGPDVNSPRDALGDEPRNAYEDFIDDAGGE
jgi:hypothetical protein